MTTSVFTERDLGQILLPEWCLLSVKGQMAASVFCGAREAAKGVKELSPPPLVEPWWPQRDSSNLQTLFSGHRTAETNGRLCGSRGKKGLVSASAALPAPF